MILFFFGFSKLDVMFGYKSPEAVKIPYNNIIKPGVDSGKKEITAIGLRLSTNLVHYSECNL